MTSVWPAVLLGIRRLWVRLRIIGSINGYPFLESTAMKFVFEGSVFGRCGNIYFSGQGGLGGWVGGVGMGNFIFVMLEASMDGSDTA